MDVSARRYRCYLKIVSSEGALLCNQLALKAPEKSVLSLRTVMARGWRKKCPRCGKGPLFVRGLTLHDTCSECGLVYLPDQGDLLGPMIFFDRVLFLIPMVTIFCFCIPHSSPWVYLPSGAVMMILLIGTMPNRNGVFLAIDYYLREVRKF